MVSEEEKFRADTFRIFGFVLLTPIGKILLDPWTFFTHHDLAYCLIYLVIAICAGIIGFIHIDLARGILSQRGISKWK